MGESYSLRDRNPWFQWAAERSQPPDMNTWATETSWETVVQGYTAHQRTTDTTAVPYCTDYPPAGHHCLPQELTIPSVIAEAMSSQRPCNQTHQKTSFPVNQWTQEPI